MKTLSKILLLMILASIARAEDPPALPPNPFSNLPGNSDEVKNPFDEGDDFDDGGDDFTPARPNGPTSHTGGGFAPARPANGAANPASVRAEGGSNTNTNAANRLPPATSKEIVENFDYPDAEILDVAKAISKLTGRNFIYNPQDIKGRISVVSQTPITVGDAWNAFLTALNMRSFALVPSGKYLRIERLASAKEKQTPIYTDKKAPNNDEFITRVVPLRYIDATEFEQAFRLWIPRESRMQAYAQTNTIIITDTSTHINRMVELINLLDVAGYQESLVVVPIKNAVAKDIARLIEQILNEGRGASSQFGAPGRPQPTYGAPARTGGRGRSGGSSISKIIADDRTNALIVKANATGIQEIRALVRRLDQRAAANSQNSGRIHVIRLQFADAETLAKVLNPVTSGSGAKTQNRAFPVFGEVNSSAFSGEIKVSPDKSTQSLIVQCAPADFVALKKVVEVLDVPRDQVFIEALILEMTLNRGHAYGTSFISGSNGIALPSASGALTSLLSGNPITNGFVLGFKHGPEKPGPSMTVGGQKVDTKFNSLNGLLELFQANGDANVVATPQIIAMDNEKATFQVSETSPQQQATTVNNVTTTSFQNQTADLLLEVTPQINKGSNFVKLDINQKMENFDATNVPAEIVGKSTGKNTRATQTKVFVQSEDTVVLSGMIRDRVDETISKIPLLGDIPVLGWLFKNSKASVIKTNLMVFITPRIIKQYDQIRKVLNRRLLEHDDFVRENLGSRDPFNKRLDNVKQGLPELTVIEPLPQAKNMESTSINTPSGPDRDDNDDYYDPNAFYYPPDGGQIPLPPMDSPQPNIGEPPQYDNGGAAPAVIPQDGGGGVIN
ncbi:MAG: type II secretion system secretin GspD [Bdellovibrionota bacterium]